MREQLFSHTLLFAPFQYISYKSFILNLCSLNCVSISETTPSSLHTVLYNVSENRTQHFYPHTYLEALCQKFRNKSVFLKHGLLHCVSISETKYLSSSNIGYTVSAYQRQHFYPQKLLVILGLYISDKILSSHPVGLHCVCI